MNYRELEVAFLESQKEVFKLRAENDELRSGQRWCDVVGSSWELAQAEQKQQQSRTSSSFCNASMRLLSTKLQNYEANERLVTSAFRQIKYELYCATVDLLGFSLHVTQGRNCIVRCAYDLGDAAPSFEFFYDEKQHRYVDLLWTETTEKFAHIYQYWVQENCCLPGFMAAVFLQEFGLKGGPPPPRVRGYPGNDQARQLGSPESGTC